MAVQVTVVVPTTKLLPLAGLQAVVTPGQLSLPMAAYVTVAAHSPAPLLTSMLAGHAMVGACASVIVTVKVQALAFMLASVAVQVTVVGPTGKLLPLAGLHTTTNPAGQLSLAVGAKLTTAAHIPGSVFWAMFCGQVMTGAVLSFTVTVKVQGWLLFP